MKLPRRNFLHLAVGAAALPAVSRVTRAQIYPTRPERIIVGFPAGGSASDIVARLMGQWLSERLGQQFVVENQPGAATNLATEAVVRAPFSLSQRRMRSITRFTTTSVSISSATSRQSRALSGCPLSCWSIHRFQPKPFPSLLRTPRPIRASSTWRRAAAGADPMSTESCSRRWPASTWSTSRIAAIHFPIC